jgi:DNA-binding NarL/FixJ family response regulator
MSFSCADPQNLLLRPQLPAHQSQSIREGRTGLVVPGCSADDTFALGHVSMGEERDQRKQVPATPGLFSGSPAPTNAAGAFPTLTDRKREILHLIAQGHPNPSIARQVSSSTKTVGNYVSNIFTKLQVADRVQAIIRAREAGLG